MGELSDASGCCTIVGVNITIGALTDASALLCEEIGCCVDNWPSMKAGSLGKEVAVGIVNQKITKALRVTSVVQLARHTQPSSCFNTATMATLVADVASADEGAPSNYPQSRVDEIGTEQRPKKHGIQKYVRK